jgi:hypothetical protein
MIKIKNIAIQSMKMGLYTEAETILRDLVDTQCQSMGLLNEETLNSIALWSETLAILERWDHLEEVFELLSSLEHTVSNPRLTSTVAFVHSLQAPQRKSS